MEVVRFVSLHIQTGAASARKEGRWMDAVDTAPLSVCWSRHMGHFKLAKL